MKKLLTTLLATAVIGGTVFSSNLVAGDKKMNLSNKEKAVALLNSIETGDHDTVAYVNAKNYTQHNLAVGDGLAGFGEVLSHLLKGSAKVSVKRSFVDGDYVLHTLTITFLVQRSDSICLDSKTDSLLNIGIILAKKRINLTQVAVLN